MKTFLNQPEVIPTLIILIIAFLIHRSIIWSAGKLSKKVERSKLRKQYLNRYVGYVIWTMAVIAVILVWSLKRDGFLVALGSTFAVVGVALFANWSILSNVTASFILYFTFPYKIGDRVRIHDKDLPVTAVIEDIKGFYTILRTAEGELITYPNNLLLQKGVSILYNREESIFDIDKHEETDPTAR
ncbi:mechanosensitive ion channel protein MscS [Nonlabens sp. YIK11]|uniref:mechanosensitive ion channel domain-containing protein n=1 Tax=Nonlabens sp. YIK11 TaxID=1453349 RepID=UPI0006DC5307|nr:mechanosensitive ion channel domain-containing protein [Nonlabens sp. YIK11]KQC33556.1 mechanosensitive ion channel protein MscS [Nonlabens sp. YIK11]